MKKNIVLATAMAAMLFSCKDTQKQDEQNAQEKTEQAVDAAELSTEQEEASDVNAVTAVTNAIQANIDQAMSKIAMPKFTKNNAKSLAESFHKDLSGLVNANSGKKATEYANKLTALKDEYNKKIAKEKIDANDKKSLDKYVVDLLQAVQSVTN
ncbi:hypothetical protein [Flavobacterium branchiicola]|uniref:Lipoprotein n=1 Tax=Flavobacterium branchiicola TaxID=1114875 RepID=A0ABV9P9C4_9FLAO|nr:hypothetical protein [Flavobacterium branchiicola]MBS7253007.1 hypothetical protein [Flavobacterium branchiicola]